jgi:chromosome segregation ATPase
MKTKIEIAMEKATQQFKQAKHDYDTHARDRNILKQEADLIENMIKEKNSHHHEQGQFNNMFNHIMKANIPGVLGRLGDLGDVPKQYEEVVSTACGRIDNVVCETYDAAQKVLDLLKKNKLGRATCIILEKIK